VVERLLPAAVARLLELIERLGVESVRVGTIEIDVSPVSCGALPLYPVFTNTARLLG